MCAVSPWTAQRLGAIVGAALAVSFVVWLRTRAVPCPGAVTIEFHPPLADPGGYAFELKFGNAKPCRSSVSLPETAGSAPASNCGMARQLRTQVRDGQVSIAELSFAAAPERFHLRVTRNSETLYDLDLEPKYAPYPTTRADDKHFCGDRARVVPSCLRGSSACEPFPITCGAPEACTHTQYCCLTPDWGKDFGPKAASECASKNSCFAHFGHLLCTTDGDCPADMRCMASPVAHEFSPAPRTCETGSANVAP
ncbi:MAG TPA: hypothetical protein VHW01_02175 [Polyangiaceae bacterium]|nr:hypothetical protein [Polyangiaceae bacterium]